MIEIFGVAIKLDFGFAMVLTAVVVAGLVRGYTGFGSALIVVPVLAYVFGPHEAVVMHSVIELPVVFSLIPAAVKSAQRNVALPMIAMLSLTIPIGALVLTSVDSGILKVAISAVVLIMVALLSVQQRLTALLGRGSTIAGGAVGGLMQGATGIGGPPIVSALIARNDRPDAARGNIIAVMSTVVLCSLVWFAAYGLITREILVKGILISPLCLIATSAGSFVFRHDGGHSHRSATLVILALTALLTIVVSLAGPA